MLASLCGGPGGGVEVLGSLEWLKREEGCWASVVLEKVVIPWAMLGGG
jgi:hypothetical protein